MLRVPFLLRRLQKVTPAPLLILKPERASVSRGLLERSPALPPGLPLRWCWGKLTVCIPSESRSLADAADPAFRLHPEAEAWPDKPCQTFPDALGKSTFTAAAKRHHHHPGRHGGSRSMTQQAVTAPQATGSDSLFIIGREARCMKDESWGHFRGKKPQAESNLCILQTQGGGTPEEGQQLPTRSWRPSWAMRPRAWALPPPAGLHEIKSHCSRVFC